jgi:hypothetical protein
MATIRFVWPDDDPIFSGEFTVFFPVPPKRLAREHDEAPKMPREHDVSHTPEPPDALPGQPEI